MGFEGILPFSLRKQNYQKLEIMEMLKQKMFSLISLILGMGLLLLLSHL
jgi:hypothetical protein